MKRMVLTMLLGALAANAAAQTLPPQEAAQARRTIVAWLECEECTSGELKAVVALGQTAVPSLRAALLTGPSPASRELVRLRLTKAYKDLAAYARTHPRDPVPVQEATYVATYLGNFAAVYQIRSAEGLGAIGGRDARPALEAALKQPLRPDVRAAVKAALAALER